MTTMKFSASMIPLSLVVLLASLVVVNGQIQSLIPEGLLDLPEVCMDQLSADILPCAIENQCFNLLPTDAEMDAIPSESEITSCEDVEIALCPITTRCPVCKTLADDFFRCTIVNNDVGISQNITDLIMGCSLDCSSLPEEDEEDLEEEEEQEQATTLEPIAAPTEAPDPVVDSVPPSGAPAGVSDAGSSTEAPTAAESSGVVVAANGMGSWMMVLFGAAAATMTMGL